jgi:hypothetical protein
MNRTGTLSVAFVSLCLACGEGPPGSSDAKSNAFARTTANRIQMVSSPRAILGSLEPIPLTPSVAISEIDHDLVHIADVSIFENGKVAVLDRGDGKIHLFRPDGSPIRSFSRSGEGQSELLHPFALAAVGGNIVVWSLGPTKVFSVFDSTGTFLRSIPPPGPGDWSRLMFRLPVSMEKHLHVPLVEDLTQRISEFSDGQFLHSARPDETQWYDDPAYAAGFVPEETVIRYSVDLTEIDTLSVLAGPPSTEAGEQFAQAGSFLQVIWAPRDHWVARNGFLATSSDAERTIRVTGAEGDTTVVVEWEADPMPLDEDAKLWMVNGIILRDSIRLGDERWEEIGLVGNERQAWVDDLLDAFAFSDTEPEIGWLGLSGKCLLVAPWDPAANLLGVSQDLLVIGLGTRTLLGAVRIPRIRERLRTTGGGKIWATHLDSFGGQVLEGFPIPFEECSG